MPSSSKVKRVGVLAIVAAALLLAGCHYVGGGTLRSATGEGKAQFSFNLDCPPGSHTVTGSLTYVDASAGIYIHGTGSAVYVGSYSCGTNSESDGVGIFSGTYTTFRGPTETGTFDLTVTAGRSGLSSASGASVCLTLFGGLDYKNTSPVLAGQIQAIGGPNA